MFSWRRELTSRRLRQLWYAPLLAAAMTLMLARLLVFARLLDVEAFGELSAGLLISSTFCMLACLGLQPMLHRELPVLLVRGRVLAGMVFIGQSLLVAGISAAVLIALALVVGIGGNTHPILLVVGLLHGLSQQLFLLATIESRSRGDPLRFARQALMRAFCVSLAGTLMAYGSGAGIWTLIAEAVVSFVLAQGLVQGTFRRASVRAGLVYRLAFARLRMLPWRSAIALLLVSSIAFLLLNADRWVAAQSLTTDRFAQYSFAWMLLLAAQALQLVANASIFPLIARRFARLGPYAAYELSAAIGGSTLALGALVGVPVVLISEAAIERFFPVYRPAIELVPLFAAVAVLRVSDFWSTYFVITGQERRLLALNFAAATAGAAVWYAWVRPWQQDFASLGLRDFGLLAACLSVASYLVTGFAAWQSGRAMARAVARA